MELKPLKVSQLNKYIKRIISNDVLLYSIEVEGEVSNYKHHKSGYIFFSLKDSISKINCMFFQENMAEEFNQKIKDGENVIVRGSIDIYEKQGVYRIIVDRIKTKGTGDLKKKFDELQKKLTNEGLFDDSYKKTIPKYPNKIGIITSKSGATVHDMIENINRRNPTVNIVIISTLMQGTGSELSIVESIETLNKQTDIDVIILGRGGGAIEDLWSFNEEVVVRAIFNSKVPIISAIGHETDYTLSDYVADIRASTPSTAAELVVKDIKALKEYTNILKESLQKYRDLKFEKSKSIIETLLDKLKLNSPRMKLMESQYKLMQLSEKKKYYMESIILKSDQLVSKYYEQLKYFDSNEILSRGYAVILNIQNEIVVSKKHLNDNDELVIKLKDGDIRVKIVNNKK